MAGKTIPRPTTLNALSPESAAARVGDFIGAPQASGPWHIDGFTVREEDELYGRLTAVEQGSDRFAPAGSYLSLKGTDDEDKPFVMMSNTPDEISDHTLIFDHAEGRVLVHGLGLSCVVSGLLAKPEVEHIDVVELSGDVIRMVGPAYADEPRVTIHQGNCLTYEWPDNARWDYVWHDIWAKISDDNLEDDTAENGISYRKLFDRFRDRAFLQEAWAFDLALAMRESDDLRDQYLERWGEHWRESSPEDRINMILDFHIESSKLVRPTREQLTWLMKENNLFGRLESDAQGDTPPSLLIESQRFFPEARLMIPDLIEDEYEKYGLVPDEFGMAMNPMEVRT